MFCLNLSRVRKAKLAISWYFFVVGTLTGNWAAIIPFVKKLQGINNGVLGAILVGAVAGAIISLPVITYCNEHYGCGISTTMGSVSLILLFPLLGLDEHLGVFVLAIIAFGFGMGCTDVSVNGQAVLCEKITRTPCLGLFHCIYAIGGLLGALTGGLIMEQGVAVLHEVAFVSFVLILPGFVFSWWLFSSQEEKLINQQAFSNSGHMYEQVVAAATDNPVVFHPEYRTHSEDLVETERRQSGALSSVVSSHDDLSESGSRSAHTQSTGTAGGLSLNHGSGAEPSSSIDSRQTDWQVYNKSSTDGNVDYVTLIKLCALCFIAYFGEGSIGDWSAVYLMDDLRSSAFQCTLGFVGFQVFVALGRFYSDYAVVYLGRQRLLQVAGLVAATGLALTVIAPSLGSKYADLSLAVIGFSLCGAGMSVVAPSVISMAGSGIGGMTPSGSIAYVSSVSYVGVMVGPPLLGGLSLVLGLRWSFLIDAAIMSLIAVIACFLGTQFQRDQSETVREPLIADRRGPQKG